MQCVKHTFAFPLGPRRCLNREGSNYILCSDFYLLLFRVSLGLEEELKSCALKSVYISGVGVGGSILHPVLSVLSFYAGLRSV